MAFHDVRFPADLSFGALGGPERRAEIVTLANGFEERNTPWAHSRRRYDAGLGLRSLDDVAEVIAFFEARRGQLHAFRWKDWLDYRSGAPSVDVTPLDQPIGVGDGVETVFALGKTYTSGAESYLRPVQKPVGGSVVVAVGGDAAVVQVNATTGEVTFDVAPDPGAQITAGFEFDVPVRFDTDRLQTSAATFHAGQVPSVPVVEVRV